MQGSAQRVLVTGAAGFIGSSLVKGLLSEGHAVLGIDNLSTGHIENLEPVLDRMQFTRGDVRDAECMRMLCRGVDVVYHEAALPSVPKSVIDPVASHVNNIDATLTCLLAARDSGVRRVIYAASSSAYGESATLPKHEAMPTAPLSPYAVQKLAGEHYMQSFTHVYGLETVCLRYFNVFGPGQAATCTYAGVLAKFITCMLQGARPTIFGDGGQTRDFTYIDNVVSANLLAMAAPAAIVSGRVYNIACAERHSLVETYMTLARLIGFAEPPLFTEGRSGDIRHSLADITRAQEQLGYRPGVGFEEGLRRTVAWYAAAMDRRAVESAGMVTA